MLPNNIIVDAFLWLSVISSRKWRPSIAAVSCFAVDIDHLFDCLTVSHLIDCMSPFLFLSASFKVIGMSRINSHYLRKLHLEISIMKVSRHRHQHRQFTLYMPTFSWAFPEICPHIDDSFLLQIYQPEWAVYLISSCFFLFQPQCCLFFFLTSSFLRVILFFRRWTTLIS